jgi:hypothetical protein
MTPDEFELLLTDASLHPVIGEAIPLFPLTIIFIMFGFATGVMVGLKIRKHK